MSEWWKRGVIYQIYPRSFQDSDGDGIGDLGGIIRRLDYLQWLGIDAIWLSPIYPSPMADFGYDVADYTDVDPLFGSLADFDELVRQAHRRQIRIILDFVPNHTSDRHPWFLEARSARDNPRREWYYWRDPGPEGGPPNNWLSRFDGRSAWAWDERTGQYYLHTFLREQPDLNWRNPEVREAMLEAVRFWLERGVDGLRVDVAYRVMKDPKLRDNPANPEWEEGMDPSFRLVEKYTKNTPDNHRFNRWLREVIEAYPERVLIGEMNLPVTELVKYYGTPERPEFDLPFNFRLIFSPWEADNVRRIAGELEERLPEHGWPNWVLSNHDQPRFATRAGSDQARNGLLFLLTMRGTPVIYYGDELGLESVDIPPDQVQDPWELLTPGLGLGRDSVRTPMRWEPGPRAGFCPPEVEPWLPVGPAMERINVRSQQAEPRSILRLTRQLIELRRTNPPLQTGAYRALAPSPELLGYERSTAGQSFIILLNFGDQVRSWTLPAGYHDYELVLSTYLDQPRAVAEGRVRLRANEGLILERNGG
jgi:alpha-glucosidase